MSAGQQVYAVQVPAGVPPGGTFHAQVAGQTVALTCPPGIGPGQSVQFSLASAVPSAVPSAQAFHHGAPAPAPSTGVYGGATAHNPYAAAPPAPGLGHGARADIGQAGKHLFLQGLGGDSSVTAIGSAQPLGYAATPAISGPGKPIQGLSPRLVIPQPKVGQVTDWHQTYRLDVGQEMLLDGSVKKIKFGLAWDAGTDVDGSCLLFDEQFRCLDVISYRQLKSRFDDAVEHSGDDRTGDGGGDDETIKIKLRKLPASVMYVLCCVSVFSSHQSFHDVRKLHVRLYHGSKKPKKSGKLLVHYDMSRVSMLGNSMLVAVLVRKGAWWGIRAVGQSAGQARTATELVSHQQGQITSLLHGSPCAHAPRFRVRLTVQSGSGLAPRDLNGLADPFVQLKFRKRKAQSGVVRRTLDPHWSGAEPACIVLESVDLAEAKKLVISVWDWDRFTPPDFMGRIKIPAAALANLGPGSHALTEALAPHPKDFPMARVSGSLRLDVQVEAL